jgi:hypothetical protein
MSMMVLAEVATPCRQRNASMVLNCSFEASCDQHPGSYAHSAGQDGRLVMAQAKTAFS